MTRLRYFGLAFASLTIVGVLLAVARYLNGVPEGLRGTYFPTTDWQSTAAAVAVDPRASTSAILSSWPYDPAEPFSAIWDGSFIVFQGATYTFATTSDDGSWLYIDDRLIVDNGGNHPAKTVSAEARIEQGVHRFQVKYFQSADLVALDVSWAHGRSPQAIPPWMFTPGQPGFARFLIDVALRRLLALVEWLWIAMIPTGLCVAAWPALRRLWQRIPLAVWAVIAGSIVLNVIGIWSGLAERSGWLGDEVAPIRVISALSQLFSQGWWEKYPPVHYYILAAAFSPVLLLERLGRIDAHAALAYDLLLLISRLVSIVAGAGILIAAYLTCARAFSRRAGFFAVLSLSVLVLFICYAKMTNVDVPYVFWFAISLLFYVRFLQAPTLKDIVLFAATGALAIGTKDQAYGLYVGTPLVVVYAVWQERRRAGDSHPLARALVDRRILAAGAVALVVFGACHNVLFNYAGFLSHVRFIMTDGSQGYRAFEPTLTGRLQLLALTARLDRWSWGWPLFAISLAGWIVAVATPATRYMAVALSVVAASYYLTFINVILYNYDRFLLPVAVVQALFAGVFLDWWLSAPRPQLWWRRAAAAGVFAYSLLYAGMADVLMVRDSRYAVDRWLHSHAGTGKAIGTAFQDRNRPPLEGFDIRIIETVPELQAQAPAFYVVDADYARAVPRDSDMGNLLDGLRGGRLGYTLVLRYRTPAPWPWLPGAHPELVGPRLDNSVSSLREINPTFEVFERAKPAS